MALQDLRYFVPYVSCMFPIHLKNCSAAAPRCSSCETPGAMSTSAFGVWPDMHRWRLRCCVHIPGSYPIMPLHNFVVFFFNMVRSWSTAFLPGLWAAHGEEQLVKNPEKFTSRLDCLSLCFNLFGYGTVGNGTRGIWYIKSTYASYTSH